MQKCIRRNENKERVALRSLVYKSIGEASMCWSEAPHGNFDSCKAEEIAENIIMFIDNYFEIKKIRRRGHKGPQFDPTTKSWARFRSCLNDITS